MSETTIELISRLARNVGMLSQVIRSRCRYCHLPLEPNGWTHKIDGRTVRCQLKKLERDALKEIEVRP